MRPSAEQVVVAGAFDDLRSRAVRFLQEAARLGELTVLLWSDETVRQLQGKPPRFPEAERLYLLQAIRYVEHVRLIRGEVCEEVLPALEDFKPTTWIVEESGDSAARRAFCKSHGLRIHVVSREELSGFPEDLPPQPAAPSGRKRILVTGCYDWLHSGHVRFFEQLSAYGDLYVVVGDDANLRQLKGPGHPLFPQDERRYLVGAVRYVKQALIASGHGWLDAEPEIQRLKPDIYAVNEDGDRGGKREYCEQHGIAYLVLRRAPAPGLPPRTSTDLRGF